MTYRSLGRIDWIHPPKTEGLQILTQRCVSAYSHLHRQIGSEEGFFSTSPAGEVMLLCFTAWRYFCKLSLLVVFHSELIEQDCTRFVESRQVDLTFHFQCSFSQSHMLLWFRYPSIFYSMVAYLVLLELLTHPVWIAKKLYFSLLAQVLIVTKAEKCFCDKFIAFFRIIWIDLEACSQSGKWR